MQEQEFLDLVREQAGLADDETALAATRATLETLGERITGGEATDLASQLPERIGAYAARHAEDHRQAEIFGLEEFYRRVADREDGVSELEAQQHARAVFNAVRDAVSEGQVEDVLGQLPPDFAELAGCHRFRPPRPRAGRGRSLNRLPCSVVSALGGRLGTRRPTERRVRRRASRRPGARRFGHLLVPTPRRLALGVQQRARVASHVTMLRVA